MPSSLGEKLAAILIRSRSPTRRRATEPLLEAVDVLRSNRTAQPT